MSAKHALLGLLLDRPSYPYELGDRLERRLGPAWRLNPGQLSQTIARLERDGYIETVDGRIQRNDRQVKAITPSGSEEFDRWYDDGASHTRPTRRPLLVKLTLGGRRRLQAALTQIDAHERDCAAALAELATTRGRIDLDQRPLRADQVLLYLNLTAEVFDLESELRLAELARATVLWMLEQELVWPSGGGAINPAAERSTRSGDARKALFCKMKDNPLRSAQADHAR